MGLDNLQKLQLYIRDFGYTKSQVNKVVRDTAKKTKKSEQYVINHLVNILQQQVNDVFAQAEQHHMKLKDVQSKLVDHMSKHRGAIAAFGVGVGKTLLAVSTANALQRIASVFGIDIQIIVVTPTSLQENFKKEMINFGADPKDPVYKFYTIATFSNRLRDDLIPNIERSFVIIDEAHNLKKDYRMEFAKYQIKEDLGTRAALCIDCAEKAWKTLLLTATPLYNRTHDIVNLVAMAKGENPPLTSSFFSSMCPSGYDKMTDANKEKCDQRLLEYFGCMLSFADPPEKDYPSLEKKITPIVMNKQYLTEYLHKEAGLATKQEEKKKKKYADDDDDDENESNAFMTLLRQASNNLQPCMKCDAAFEILKQGKKSIVFSEYRTSGLDLVKAKLDEKNIAYYEINGSMSQKDRKIIVEKINSNDKNNAKILFITRAGGEGLDLKGIRNVIILESGWNESGPDQVIGRARRYKSHTHLPKDQQTVVSHRFMMIKPGEQEWIKMLTSGDVTQFEQAIGYILHNEIPTINSLFPPEILALSRSMNQLLKDPIKNKAAIDSMNKQNESKIKTYKREVNRVSADLYLFALSLSKRVETDIFGTRLRMIDINNMMCDDFLYNNKKYK